MQKKSSFSFCISLVFSSLDAQRRLSLTRTLPLRGELFRFAQGNFSALGKKRNEFLLFCARFFVTLALPNLLCTLK